MAGAILNINTYGNPTVRFPCTSDHNRPSYLPQKPTAVKMTTHTTTHAPHPHWASVQAEIDAHIKQSMPIKEPLVVFEPMDHLVFMAPRTMVPALCVTACELVGGDRRQAMAAASALLLLQAAYHTHEHLPLTDRPRPKPMTSHAYGPNVELMTGDGIVPFGFGLLSRSDDPAQENPERVLRVIIEISRAAGSEGVIDGYYRKAMLQGGSDGGELSHVESIEGIVEKNEGALHACAGACGAVLGGGSEEEIERLRKYGFYVGMVQGLMAHKGLRHKVQEARDLAFKELQFFKDKEVDAISSFVHV